MVDNLNQWFTFQTAQHRSIFTDFLLGFVKGQEMEILATPQGLLGAEGMLLEVGTF